MYVYYLFVCGIYSTDNTFFGNLETPECEVSESPTPSPTPGPNSNPNRFFGTSAAAPNVAALALLLLQQNPELTPNQVYKILGTTAIDMGEPGFDFTTGHGFVNGLPAIVKAKKKALKTKKQTKRNKNALKKLDKLEVCYDYEPCQD